MWILLTMVYLSGSSWGPVTGSAGPFESLALCENAGKSLIEMNAGMMKTNLTGGRTQRDVLFTKCVPATSTAAQGKKDAKTLKN